QKVQQPLPIHPQCPDRILPRLRNRGLSSKVKDDIRLRQCHSLTHILERTNITNERMHTFLYYRWLGIMPEQSIKKRLGICKTTFCEQVLPNKARNPSNQNAQRCK